MMVAENHLTVHDLVWPTFVQEGTNTRTPVGSMPGVDRLTIDLLIEAAREAQELGIPAIAIFPVVGDDKKSELAEEAYNADSLMCRALRAVKEAVPNIGLIADVALDPYTANGQDGLMKGGMVDNDSTLEVLARQAVALAQAGADIVAPSDMMDGRIGAVRKALDEAGLPDTSILAYAAKYASNFYGPFRDAIGSAAALGRQPQAQLPDGPFQRRRSAARSVAGRVRRGGHGDGQARPAVSRHRAPGA